MYFYKRLRDLREDNDKNQSQIADILKTTRQQYARWENGENELPMHHFVTLAKYYNVSIDYLAGLISTPNQIATYTEVKNSFNNNNGTIDFKA